MPLYYLSPIIEMLIWMGLSRIYVVINIKIRQSFCSQSRIYPIKASVILSKRYSERGFNVINVLF